MPLVTREGKGSKLTVQEMDGNLLYLDDKANISGYTKASYTISPGDLLSLSTRPVKLLVAINGFYDINFSMSYIRYNPERAPYEITTTGETPYFEIYFNDDRGTGPFTHALADPSGLEDVNTSLSRFFYPAYIPSIVSSCDLYLGLTTGGVISKGDGSIEITIFYKTIER